MLEFNERLKIQRFQKERRKDQNQKINGMKCRLRIMQESADVVLPQVANVAYAESFN